MSTENKNALIDEVSSILQKIDIPDRHTFFQIEKFIIGKEPTAQSQLWAIVREMQARKETIKTLEKDLLDAEDNLELFDIKIERLNRQLRITNDKDADQDLNIQEIEINIRKLQREKQHLMESARKVNKKMTGILEEVDYLLKGYQKITQSHGELKPLDDMDAQKEMWNEKLLEDYNLRVILQRPFDPEFIKTVMCLHDDAPVKQQVTAFLKNVQIKMIAATKQQVPQIEIKPKTIAG